MQNTAVIVDFDGISHVGHFMAYNEKLSAAFSKIGWDTKVICNRSIDPAILAVFPNYLPRLTIHSWEINGFAASGIVSHIAEAELCAAFFELLESGLDRIYAYVYCGALETTLIFRRFLEKGLPIYAHINLFHNTTESLSSPNFQNKWLSHLTWLHANRDFLYVTAPTHQWADELKKITGLYFPPAIHPSTTVTDEAFHTICRPPPPPPFRVLFPTLPRKEKGYELVSPTIQQITASPQNENWQCIIRIPYAKHTELKQTTLPHPDRCEVIHGELSNTQFANMLASSHVAVIPYLPPDFTRRTSGLLIDCLYFGLPVVVIEGTWLADIVKKYNCGLAVPPTPEAINAAISTIFSHYQTYRVKTTIAAEDYFRLNSWHALATSIAANWPANARQVDQLTLLKNLLDWYQTRDYYLQSWFYERKEILVDFAKGKFYSLLAKLAQRGFCRIAIFGAGCHTRKLLNSIFLPEDIELVCIFDDTPKTNHLHNIPIITPQEKNLPAIDAIVISSDSIEEKLYTRAKALKIAPVFTIYGKFEEHEKNSSRKSLSPNHHQY